MVVGIIVAVIAVLVTTICIVQNKNKGSQSGVAYDEELVKELQSLGDIDLTSVSNFKDGVYTLALEEGVANPITLGFEKIGNCLVMEYRNSGQVMEVCKLTEDTKYEKATTYKLSCVEMTNGDDAGSVDEIIEKVKAAQASRDTLKIEKDKHKLKVTDDGSVLIDDIRMRTYKIEKMSEEEAKEKEDALQKSIEEHRKEAEELNANADLPEYNVEDGETNE